MVDVLICDAVRTPIGRYGGALASIRADDLAAIPLRTLRERNPTVDWAEVDDIVLGCANQAGEDNRNVARMAGLLAQLPLEVPGVTVNRLCGSGMDAIGIAARAIRAGEAKLMVAGGVESMSRAPFVMGKADSAYSRAMKMEDTTMGWRFINAALKAQYGVDTMPQTAENVAQAHSISRADQDAFALRSQQRAGEALASKRFAREICPVELVSKQGTRTVDTDEHPRPATKIEDLAKLKGVVSLEGSVTAGNASGINDGACAVLLATEAMAARAGLQPLARHVATAVAGVEPRLMGMGPVPAVRKLLSLTGLSLDDMDVIELNEAFAAQGLAVLRELNLPDDAPHVNPNGGAIALGHPLGMSGARLITTAAYQLKETGGRYALCTMCIGVGQGIATIIERI